MKLDLSGLFKLIGSLFLMLFGWYISKKNQDSENLEEELRILKKEKEIKSKGVTDEELFDKNSWN